MLGPTPLPPDAFALRPELLLITQRIKYALRYPSRLGSIESCELGCQIRSIPNPHEIVVAADAGSCGTDFRGVDSDHVAQCEVGCPICVQLRLNDVFYSIINLKRALDRIDALSIADEDAHNAVAVICTIDPPRFRMSREAA